MDFTSKRKTRIKLFPHFFLDPTISILVATFKFPKTNFFPLFNEPDLETKPTRLETIKKFAFKKFALSMVKTKPKVLKSDVF